MDGNDRKIATLREGDEVFSVGDDAEDLDQLILAAITVSQEALDVKKLPDWAVKGSSSVVSTSTGVRQVADGHGNEQATPGAWASLGSARCQKRGQMSLNRADPLISDRR